MEIRKATVDDIPSLIRLRDEMFSLYFSDRTSIEEMNRFSIDYFREKIPTEDFVGFVANMDGADIGCIGICFYCLSPKPGNLSEKTAYISSMYVKEPHRSQGIGRRLFENAVGYCDEKSIRFVTLHAGSEDGKPLYRSCGFRDSPEMIRTPNQAAQVTR